MAGFLPPISMSAGRGYGPACMAATIERPTSAEPVNATPSTAAATRARPVDSPPCTRLKTPVGRAARTISSRIAPVHGVSSEGLNTTVLPAMSAAEDIPTDSAAGKLNGAMTAKTP
jgi:hypothetical protein